MRAIPLLSVLPLFVAVTSPLAAQAAAVEALRPLQAMVGRWEGEGWVADRQGRASARVSEVAEYRLDGAVLVVEGRGRADEGTPTARTVHHAFGIISFDAARGTRVMRAYRADGGYVDADVAFENGRFEWGFEDARAGRIRFRAQIGADEWVEVGEISRDGGTTWMQFLEMRLRRVR